MNARISSLDGIRGLAVLMVVFSHFLIYDQQFTGQKWWTFIDGGWHGVDLFFVLSGFLITGILLDTKEKPNFFKHFFIRRILRIFPLCYAALLVATISMYVIEGNARYFTGYDSIWWYYLYASNIAISLKGDWGQMGNYFDVGHFWSLAIEEQFYLVWPFVVWFLSKRTLFATSLLMIFGGTFIRQYTDTIFGDYSLASTALTICKMDTLAAGALLAIWMRSDQSLPWSGKKWTLGATYLAIAAIGVYMFQSPSQDAAWGLWWYGLFFLGALFFLTPHRKLVARVVFVLSTMMTVFSDVNEAPQYKVTYSVFAFASMIFLAMNENPKGLVRRFGELSILRNLGTYSYAIYIFHMFFMKIWMMAFGDRILASGLHPLVGQTIFSTLAFALTYLAARFSWKYLESPLLALKDKWAGH